LRGSKQIFALVLVEQFHDIAHLLRPRTIGHQQRIGRIYDDQILNAQQRDQFMPAIDIVPGRIGTEQLGSRRI
jgi:hypothetical protein